MKRILGLAVALLLAGGANARAKDAFEDVIKDTLSTMKDVTKVLETVKDEDSAKAAKPKVKELAKKIQALKKRSKDLGKPTKEQEEAVKKYLPQFIEVSQKLTKESERVKKVTGGPELLKELELAGKPDEEKPKDKPPADKKTDK